MKKVVLFLLVLSFSVSAAAQLPYQKRGIRDQPKAIAPDSAILIPTGCGSPWNLKPADSALKRFALYGDTCNHRLWVYDSKQRAWDTIHIGPGGSGGGPAFDSSYMEARKLNKSDTASMLTNYKHWLAGYLTAASIAGKLNNSDTSTMLTNYKHWAVGYLKAADIAGKTNNTDTASMLTNYRHWLAGYISAAQLSDSLNAKAFYVKNATAGAGQLLYTHADTLKSKIIAAGYGWILDSTGLAINLRADTGLLGTKNYIRQKLDSLIAMFGSGATDNPWTSNKVGNNYHLTGLGKLSTQRAVVSGGTSYSTLNPAAKATGITLSSGNLVAQGSTNGSTHEVVKSTIGLTTENAYWQVTITSGGSGVVGISNASAGLNSILGGDANSYGYGDDGEGRYNGANVFYGASWTTGDVLTFKFSGSAHTLEVLKNNTSVNTFTGIASGTWYPSVSCGVFSTPIYTANFGASVFTYSVPGSYNAGVYSSGSTTYIKTLEVDSLGVLSLGDSTAKDIVATDMALAKDSTGKVGQISVYDTKFYLNTDALKAFRTEIAKLKKAAKKTVHFAIEGDSNTDADGVFQKPLQEEARLSGFNVVPGWSCANPNQYPSFGVLRSVSAGWVNRNRVDAGKSVSLNSVTSNSNSDYIQFETVTNGIAYDGIKVFYLRRSGGGTINYIEGGITLHTQSTAGTAGTVGCWDIPSLSYTNRDFVLRPAGTDSVEILGVYMYSKTVPSLAISKFAHTGACSYDYANIGSAFDAQVDSMGVDLVLINLGTNDMNYDSSAAHYKNNLITITDRLRADSVKSIVIIAPSDNDTNPTDGKLAYNQAAKMVAIAKSAAFINLYEYHGPWEDTSGLWFDYVHFNYEWAGKKHADLIGGLIFGHDKSETQLINNSSPVSGGAAGKLLFQSATNTISQNTNLHFDNPNVRLGLGTAAPDFDFHIRKTVNGSVIFGLINESSGANSRTIIRQGRSDAGGYYTDLGYAGENFVGTYPAASYAIENSSNTTGGFWVNNVANAAITFMTNNTARLAINGNGSWAVNGSTGTALQVLQSNGSGSAPSWVTLSGGSSYSTIKAIKLKGY